MCAQHGAPSSFTIYIYVFFYSCGSMIYGVGWLSILSYSLSLCRLCLFACLCCCCCAFHTCTLWGWFKKLCMDFFYCYVLLFIENSSRHFDYMARTAYEMKNTYTDAKQWKRNERKKLNDRWVKMCFTVGDC